MKSLQDNLDTPGAIAKLQKVVDYVMEHSINGLDEGPFKDFLKFVDQALGLGLTKRDDITDDQKDLIRKRDEERHQGEFKEADKLRDELVEQGLNLDDTEHGTRWSRSLSVKPTKD